jgi:hypothetical protein
VVYTNQHSWVDSSYILLLCLYHDYFSIFFHMIYALQISSNRSNFLLFFLLSVDVIFASLSACISRTSLRSPKSGWRASFWSVYRAAAHCQKNNKTAVVQTDSAAITQPYRVQTLTTTTTIATNVLINFPLWKLIVLRVKPQGHHLSKNPQNIGKSIVCLDFKIIQRHSCTGSSNFHIFTAQFVTILYIFKKILDQQPPSWPIGGLG